MEMSTRPTPLLMISGAEEHQERVSALALGRLEHPTPREKMIWLGREGSCHGALLRAATRERRAALDEAGQQLDRAASLGIRVTSLTLSDYPQLLRETDTPPLFLFVDGDLPAHETRLAVVGSRNASRYGRAATRALVAPLAQSGISIVSGLARGIDAEAHRACLEVGGRTIAILGSGMNRIYPSEHQGLAERMVGAGGCVISEFFLDSPPRRENFPRRNRVVTGLSWGCLIVEAALKSGSLISARLAMEQNREVFAVPGPIDRTQAEGVHRLIQDGAKLAHDSQDIWDELPPDRASRLSELRQSSQSIGGEGAALEVDDRLILQYLGSKSTEMDVERLVDGTGIPVARVLAALCRLEVSGLLISSDRGYYRRCLST